MAQIIPYLKFQGNCQEAMKFYESCLGGELTINLVGESPAAEHMPPEAQDKVLHSELAKDGFRLFASDMFMSDTVTPGDNVAICITGTKDEITAAFGKLSEGGKVVSPLVDEFFGMFGSLNDKYGFNWMVESDKPAAA